jgi:hypothetical protein
VATSTYDLPFASHTVCTNNVLEAGELTSTSQMKCLVDELITLDLPRSTCREINKKWFATIKVCLEKIGYRELLAT